jgi:hypothetical protein
VKYMREAGVQYTHHPSLDHGPHMG